MAVLQKPRGIFEKEIFGEIPAHPLHLSVRPVSVNEEFLGGRAVLKQLEMLLDFGDKSATIPFTAAIPKDKFPCPAIIEIRGDDGMNTGTMIENGYAFFSIYYKDISENNGNFKSGISACISPSRRRLTAPGKVAVWAWAALRILEYSLTTDEIDQSNISVRGRGIFALSAILAAKEDERFISILPENIPQIDDNLKISCPYLFSPKFVKNR